MVLLLLTLVLLLNECLQVEEHVAEAFENLLGLITVSRGIVARVDWVYNHKHPVVDYRKRVE